VKWAVALLAFLSTASAGAQERLVLPPQLEDFAKAHHCQPVSGFVTDDESDQAAPFDFGYEFHHGPPKVLLAGWCTKEAQKLRGTYTLLILAERSDHPLRTLGRRSARKKATG
jgi:hypothetical protein